MPPLCPKCNVSMHRDKISNYHYKQCGLDNVYLNNIPVYICSDCNESALAVPSVASLHRLIAANIVSRINTVSDKEFSFLRKIVDMYLTDPDYICNEPPDIVFDLEGMYWKCTTDG